MKQFKSLSDYGNVENQRFTTFHTIRLLLPLTFDAILTDQFTHNLGLDIRIGVGGIIYDLNNIVRSFQEAQTALEVGKIFDPENNVVYYEKLNIGRLIYQLPETLCEMYLEEILKDNSIDLLEPEIINTINCLFENNFNGLEASKKLSIHRNTLVYRLEKVRKITGLDLNNFNQAVTFKFAFMINKYLDNR